MLLCVQTTWSINILFPKLNFSELRTPYHTFTRLLSENGKRKGGESLSGLVPVKSDLSGDLFFFWRQIRCSNQAAFEGCKGMSMGFLVRLIPKQHIPRG